MSLNISILIPAFNEAKRLPSTLEDLSTFIRNSNLDLFKISEVIVVNDGSADQTAQVAKAFEAMLPNLSVISFPANRGKGHAIHTGLFKATSSWVLVADADQSTPWKELCVLIQSNTKTRAEIVMGSRGLDESKITTRQSFLRQSLGKSYNLFIRAITGLPYKDTQCGFKLIDLTKTKAFLSDLQVERFAWDIEFLLFAKKFGLKISEIPVEWAHKEQSRVHPIKDGLNMLWETLKARIRIFSLSKKIAHEKTTHPRA
jgi:dolichyl-phosphate beta-glucosyltransferase